MNIPVCRAVHTFPASSDTMECGKIRISSKYLLRGDLVSGWDFATDWLSHVCYISVFILVLIHPSPIPFHPHPITEIFHRNTILSQWNSMPVAFHPSTITSQHKFHPITLPSPPLPSQDSPSQYLLNPIISFHCIPINPQTCLPFLPSPFPPLCSQI